MSSNAMVGPVDAVDAVVALDDDDFVVDVVVMALFVIVGVGAVVVVDGVGAVAGVWVCVGVSSVVVSVLLLLLFLLELLLGKL